MPNEKVGKPELIRLQSKRLLSLETAEDGVDELLIFLGVCVVTIDIAHRLPSQVKFLSHMEAIPWQL
eukprot:3392740-Amphidinium_carterae.1